jgi:hypothetical protein
MSQQNEQNLMLNVELEHNLREGDEYNLLVINKGHHHHAFDKLLDDKHWHKITWRLTGNASAGVFCALDDANYPGFVWLVKTPSESVFRKLHRGPDNEISIQNHHLDKSSEGTWHYQLFARFGDKVYGVPLTIAAGGANNPNPSIKNN